MNIRRPDGSVDSFPSYIIAYTFEAHCDIHARPCMILVLEPANPEEIDQDGQPLRPLVQHYAPATN